MSSEAGRDIQPSVSRGPEPVYPPVGRPSSNLAIVSIVFAALGWTVLPFVGSIVAVVTGHAALGQIRRSRDQIEGKALAIVGLALGYFSIVVTVLVVVVIMIFLATAVPMAMNMAKTEAENARREADKAALEVLSKAEATPQTQAGVKLANEMSRDDFALIDGQGIKAKPDEIIAFYNAGRPSTDPEFALLTTQSLLYRKDGRTTEFALKDVVGLKNDAAFEKAYRQVLDSFKNPYIEIDPTTYHIEVKASQGPRMHIEIKPELSGPIFYDALESAVKAAGAKLEPAP
jgi:large-conductance mechanosensitive channel